MVWKVGLLGWAVMGASAMAAESLPASIRACAALTDSLQRLVCYDREVARFPEPAAKAAPKSTPAPGAGVSTAPATAGTNSAAPPGPATPGANTAAGTTAAPGANTAAGTTAAPGANTAAGTTGAPAAGASAAAPPAKSSGDISARVVTIDHQPNEMVLHLDNGQVWQEVQSVSGDLSLREGDTVKIERRLGSYWLRGPHVSSMRVRQIS